MIFTAFTESDCDTIRSPQTVLYSVILFVDSVKGLIRLRKIIPLLTIRCEIY